MRQPCFYNSIITGSLAKLFLQRLLEIINSLGIEAEIVPLDASETEVM
jgi:hypothetical protein